MKKLLREVARLLNESGIYRCKFVEQSGKLYSIQDDIETAPGEYISFHWTCPGILLEDIHGC